MNELVGEKGAKERKEETKNNSKIWENSPINAI